VTVKFRIREACWRISLSLRQVALFLLTLVIYLAVTVAWLANEAHKSLSKRSVVLAETLSAQPIDVESPLAEVVLLGTVHNIGTHTEEH
jgi:hypothetical protein